MIFQIRYKLVIFSIFGLLNFQLFASECKVSGYDFKNIFSRAWIDYHCAKQLCGEERYRLMINDFHNVFPMVYLLRLESDFSREKVTLNNLTQDGNINSKTVYSGANTSLNSHMADVYNKLIEGLSKTTVIDDINLIDEKEEDGENFFCYLKLNSRSDLYNQTKGDGRGLVARTILYMVDRYGIISIPTFIPEDFQLLRVWDKKYPPTPAECNRNAFIKKRQGNDNKFISLGCLSRGL